LAVSNFKKSSTSSTPAASIPAADIPVSIPTANTFFTIVRPLPSGTYTISKPTTSNSLAYYFLEENGSVIHGDTLENGTQSAQFFLSSQSDSIVVKSDAVINVTLAYVGGLTTQNSISDTIVTISSSQEVTLTKKAAVIALGGGGNSSSFPAGVYQAPGAGSGYLEFGLLGPGTYNAVIGVSNNTALLLNINDTFEYAYIKIV